MVNDNSTILWQLQEFCQSSRNKFLLGEASHLPLSPERASTPTFNGTKRMFHGKKHLIVGWFVIIKPGPGPAKRAHRRRVWRHSHQRSPTMTVLGLAPFLERSNNHFAQSKSDVSGQNWREKADLRSRTNAHKITSNDTDQQSKASRQAHKKETTSAHWLFFSYEGLIK
jgi:hypothetical protein